MLVGDNVVLIPKEEMNVPQSQTVSSLNCLLFVNRRTEIFLISSMKHVIAHTYTLQLRPCHAMSLWSLEVFIMPHILPAESAGMKSGRSTCQIFHSSGGIFQQNLGILEQRLECSPEFTGTECNWNSQERNATGIHRNGMQLESGYWRDIFNN